MFSKFFKRCRQGELTGGCSTQYYRVNVPGEVQTSNLVKEEIMTYDFRIREAFVKGNVFGDREKGHSLIE